MNYKNKVEEANVYFFNYDQNTIRLLTDYLEAPEYEVFLNENNTIFVTNNKYYDTHGVRNVQGIAIRLTPEMLRRFNALYYDDFMGIKSTLEILELKEFVCPKNDLSKIEEKIKLLRENNMWSQEYIDSFSQKKDLLKTLIQ